MAYYPLHHFSPLVIALTVKLILLVMVDAHTPPTPTHAPSYIIKYTTITGYFLQDDPKTNDSTFDYVKHPLHPFPFPSSPLFAPCYPPSPPQIFFNPAPNFLITCVNDGIYLESLQLRSDQPHIRIRRTRRRPLRAKCGNRNQKNPMATLPKPSPLLKQSERQ